MTFFVTPLGSLCVYLQTSLFALLCSQPGKYRCGCGVLISNVGNAEREHFKSDRHQKWLKSQQTTKTLSAFFVKEQNPVGSSSSSSSSITNTSNTGGTMCFGSRGSITSGGAGEPFSPGRAPQPPPQMFIRVGGVWVGGLVLGGWVPQNPKTPQPLINEAWLTRKRHTMPHSAQSQRTNYWAPRTRKRHQQEHRPQRPTESSDPTQHAKGRTGDRPGPRKGATTRRNVTQGVQTPKISWCT